MGQRRPEIFSMFQSERGDAAGGGPRQHIGRVEASAEAHLDHHDLDLPEGEKGHQRGDLEEGQPRIAQRPGHATDDLLEQRAGPLFGDGLSADADPLAEMIEVG